MTTPPLLAQNLPEVLFPRAPLRRLAETEIDLRLFVPTRDHPELEVIKAGDSRVEGENGQELKVRIRNFQVGEHVFPAGASSKKMELLGGTPLLPETEPFLPDHLALHPLPELLSNDLHENFGHQLGNEATTVFMPESRRVFCDTAYPWGTCGRVDTPVGTASGVMVGPRHVLTASHVIHWKRDGSTGWLRFRPGYFNGSAPFGEAWGVHVYHKYKVYGPLIDELEGRYDYAIVVLDRRIGNLTGWMGSRSYTDEWDGKLYWSHIGYPGHVTASNRPTFEMGIALDGVDTQEDTHQAMIHRGDVWPSQSGGPFFGWWQGEMGPRVVAVQSSRNARENNASGGQDMVHLIVEARNEHP